MQTSKSAYTIMNFTLNSIPRLSLQNRSLFVGDDCISAVGTKLSESFASKTAFRTISRIPRSLCQVSRLFEEDLSCECVFVFYFLHYILLLPHSLPPRIVSQISLRTPPSIFGYMSLDIQSSCFTRFRPSSLVLACLFLEITRFTNPGPQEHANIDSHCIMNVPFVTLLF